MVTLLRSLVRTPARLAVVAVAALAFVAGCSDESSPAPPASRPFAPPANPAPQSADLWLDRVCTALLPAVRASAPAPPVEPADPAGSRDRWAAYLVERERALTAAADGIGAAGPAPVPGGQQVTEPAVTLMRDRAAAAERAVEELRAVPANAPATLLQTVQETQSRFPLAGSTATLRDVALTPELAREAQDVPSCREAGTGAPP